MHSDFHTPSRRVRRYIQLALAGAALGTVCMAMPSHAADVIVNNTSSSGTGSLSQAITTGGHIVFDSPLTNGTQFTSSLPSITNDLSIDSTSGLNNFTVSQGLTTDNGSELDLTGNGTSGAYSITSDLTAKGDSYIDISNAYTVNGNLAADGEDSNGDYSDIDVDNSAVNGATIKATRGGYVDIYDGSTVTLSGDVTVDGVGSEWNSEVAVEDGSSLSAANLNVTNGGYFHVENSGVSLTGDASVDGVGTNGDQSQIYVHNAGLTANNLNVTNGGYVDIEEAGLTLDGDATLDGEGTSGDQSEVYLYRAGLNADNLNITNGGYLNLYEAHTTLTGDATVDGEGSNGDQSEIEVESGHLYVNNLNVINGGYVNIHDDSTVTLTGDATVDNEASSDDESSGIRLWESTLNAANLNVTNGGYVDIDGSTLDLDGTGTATADGEGRDKYPSQIGVEDNSTLNGNVVVTNGGYLYLGGAEITGDVTINANSMLRSYDDEGYYSNDLNTNDGTTTFNANSLFAPDILSGPITVDSLSVDPTAQIQPYLSDSYFTPVPVGAAYGRSVINYNSITGQFDTNVISPLDVGVEYADSEGNRTATPDPEDSGQVQLYLNSNHVDFNKLPGSQNAESLGSYLNNVINQSNTNPNVLTLSNLPSQLQDPVYEAIQNAGYDGNLNSFDSEIPTNFSSHNAQAYWNQKSFVDSIRANLDNDRNSEGGGQAFALNQVSDAGGTGIQLAALRQATAPGFSHLNYAGNNNGNSNGVWAAYNGNHQHTDGDDGIGSSDWSSSTDGFTLGYTGGSDHFSWGAAVGHQKSTLDFADLDANGEQRGWNAGLYAAWEGKSGYLNGVLGYGNFDNDSYGDLGDASFKTKATSASLEIGKHVSNYKNGSLTPYASVLWTRIKEGDATVTGALPGLTLSSGSNNIYATQLGLRYNHRMYDKDDTLKGGWQAGLAWLHQGGDTGFPVNLGSSLVPDAGTFAIQSTPLAGNSAVVQLGAYGRIHHNLIGFAGYQGTFGSSQDINAVNAGVGYQF